MAAVAAYITLLTLLQLLDTLKLRYKYKLNFIDPKQIDSLEEKVLYLVKFLESLPPRPDDPQIEPFLLEICVSVVKTCQDLDFQVVDQIRRAGRVKKDEGGKWLSAFREDMIKVISDLESIRCKVTGFNLESATLNTVSELPLISTDPSSSNSTIKSGDPKVIGFEHHVSFLKAEFILSHVKSREVIPIVGMGGIGKTTLARFVYEDPSIRRRFDKRYWATISQEYDLLRILQGILGAKDCDIIDLGTRLYQGLKGLRYLIVLDDMWDLGAWEDLRQYLPDDNQGSRIIVTSRDKNLADGLRSSKTCDVGFLSVEKSWELFCDRVFGGMCCPSEQLETIGRQIVKKCRGLPLGIITIAGLLSKSNKTSEYWSSVSKDVAALVNLEDNEHCKNTLSLSYDCLPLHLKPLFLYIGGFHNEGEGILMVELINSLVAFALVKPIHGKSIQQVTKDYLMELFQRNLIFIRYKDEINDIWRLGIHDLLRDLCLKEISHEKLFCRGFSKLDGCLKCISSSQTSFYLAQDVGEFWLCGSCNEFDKSEETSPSSLFWNIQVVWKWEWEREHGSVFRLMIFFGTHHNSSQCVILLKLMRFRKV